MDPPSPSRRMSPFAEHMGFDVVERTDGQSVVECLVTAEHTNTRGVVHGGVLSALIDMACGVAVAYQPSVGGHAAVTVSLTINYLQPALLGDRLRVVGKRAGNGKRIVACEAEIYDQAGNMVAMGVATMTVVG
jgi:acyl-coenzyme A thioesterase 13